MTDEVQVGRMVTHAGRRFWVADPPPVEPVFDFTANLAAPLNPWAAYQATGLSVRRPSSFVDVTSCS